MKKSELFGIISLVGVFLVGGAGFLACLAFGQAYRHQDGMVLVWAAFWTGIVLFVGGSIAAHRAAGKGL